MKIAEKKCRTLMGKTGLPADYCINPYTGCEHGCVYCYARFMAKYTGHKESWGEFVDVKINAPEILKKEAAKKPRGRVYLSSVCDSYQPLERKYRLTRRILEILAEHNFSATIQTKSDLLLRDIDIFKKIKNIKIGFSITCLDDKVRRIFEPKAASVQNRLKALRILKKEGFCVFVMIAPILPGLTEVKEIKNQVKKWTDFIWQDNLNIRYGNWPDIEKTVKKHYPELLSKFEARKNKS